MIHNRKLFHAKVIMITIIFLNQKEVRFTVLSSAIFKMKHLQTATYPTGQEISSCEFKVNFKIAISYLFDLSSTARHRKFGLHHRAKMQYNTRTSV